MFLLSRTAAVAAAALLSSACAAPIPQLADNAPSILVFTRTTEYRHENIEQGREVLEREGKRRGIRVELTEDPTDFTRSQLDRHRAVVFFNTTGDVLDDTQQMEFERYIQAGGGFVGIHAAADTEWKENSWPWYTRLVGAAFRSHPSTPSNVQEATIHRIDDDHPATQALPDRWTHEDEWYDYQRFSDGVNVLLEVDESTYEGGKTGPKHPIAWQRAFDGGRSFYTGLGHTAESFDDDQFLDHLFGGIRWSMGGGEAGPPNLDYSRSSPHRWRLIQKRVVSGIGEPIAMEFSGDGDLWIVERRGRVRRWDPKAEQLHEAGQLEVYSAEENGLVGITFAPDFAQTRHGYLFYAFDDGARPAHRLSRFEFRDGEVQLATEKVLLSIPIDYGPTGHTGGDLQFDGRGDLWISIGDDTSPRNVDGFAPIDQRAEEPTRNAQRSSANSQDLRGKILRIHPEEDGTYTIPEGNLFADAAIGRPEIYAMGLRNPYRFSFDEERGVLRWGDIGPDANEDQEGRGPRGYDEVNRTTKPGFFGWPLFVGDNRPYRPWDFARGEATGPFFDALAPHNASAANTGLAALPPARPAWIAYPYSLSDAFFELGGGGSGPRARSGRNALIGPVYRLDGRPEAKEALPSYYDGKILFYDFMREWVKLIEEDEEGRIRKIETLGEFDLNSPLDLVVGPDGALWVLEYGSIWFSENDDSGISRISFFAGDNPPPVAVANLEPTRGAAPLRVTLDGSASYDRNPDDRLRYHWVARDQRGKESILSQEMSATIEIEDPGVYAVTLMVEDSQGSQAHDTRELRVGNEPPDVRIEVAGNRSFFLTPSIDYRIEVDDREDGSTHSGEIHPEDVEVQILYDAQGFDETESGPDGDSRASLAENGCTSCHADEADSAGPSLVAIADRYAGDANALSLLAQRVRDGGSGEWGERDMPANGHLSQEQAKQLVDGILDLSPDRVRPAGLPLEGTLRFDQHQSTIQENEYMGARSPAQYRLVATYRDRGSDSIGPMRVREQLTFSHPNRLAADYDEESGAMRVFAPEGPLIPEALAGEPLVIGTSDGVTLRYRDLDLSGLRRLRVVGAALSSFLAGGVVEVRLDTPDGRLLGRAEIEPVVIPSSDITDIALDDVDGVHDLVLVFRALPGEMPEGALAILMSLEFSSNP